MDVSATKWEKAWKAEAKISLIYDLAGVSEYFEGNTILKDDTLSEVIDFNSRLLKKVKNTKRIEIDENTDNTKLIFNEIATQSAQDKESVKTQMVELINGFKN